MSGKFIGIYPPDWPEIKHRIRQAAGNRCERCNHDDDWEAGFALTVHHLDNDKSNCADWNLAALCQRCHLHIQGKVEMRQGWLFEHSAWMRPHIEGMLNALAEIRQ